MKPGKRQVAILAEYILDVSLSLTKKLDELFQTEFKPAFDAKWDRRADQEDWEFLEHEIKKEMRIELAIGKKRTKTKVARQLRSFQLVAVGRADDGSLVIIQPRRWDRLAITLGSNSVADDQGTLHSLHIASTSSLGVRQRAELNDLLYGLSSQRVAERHDGGFGKGRPPTKRQLVESWIKAKQAKGTMPGTQSAAMVQALKHFEFLTGKEKISGETIRRGLAKFYSQPVTTAKST
jgi:hypothetical protein